MEINAGNTAWVLMSTALVMLMTPALGFFYGGLVRRKNVLATLMHSFGTLALISGAFAERLRFKSLVLFTIAWSTLVYSPIAHWVWAVGGWLFDYGALDFAGGTVVHISSGISALVAAIVLGRRHGFGEETMTPHNLTYTILGAGLLWFGWFGFNAGSALAADGLAANALVVTNTAAAMGAITWLAVSWIRDGRPSVLGAAAGAVAGLVAITPAAGFVDASAAIVIGFGAGILCAYAVEIVKSRLGFDDALDVFAVHGVGGIWGALATGLFAKASVGGFDGLFYGEPEQLLKQAVAVGVVIVFTAGGTWIILKVIDVTIGLRVPEQ